MVMWVAGGMVSVFHTHTHNWHVISDTDHSCCIARVEKLKSNHIAVDQLMDKQILMWAYRSD